MNKETLTVYTDKDGTIRYYNVDGQLHNPGGPAIIYADGYKEHRINDQLHNPDGPAVIWPDGNKEYWIDDHLHNPHGPAVVWADGSKAHWTKVKKLTEVDIKAWQAQQSAPLHNKTATIDGVEYTLTAK